MALKTVRVVAAVITDGGVIFAAKRGYGEFKGCRLIWSWLSISDINC